MSIFAILVMLLKTSTKFTFTNSSSANKTKYGLCAKDTEIKMEESVNLFIDVCV